MTEPKPQVLACGNLAVADGNTIYWETLGTDGGAPIVFLHGGPGAGLPESYAKFFDLDEVFVVGFDQRGCGRSRPRVIDPGGTLYRNTTAALIEDIEALREHLGIERWLVVGNSWGTTLGLAYAQRYPERCSGVVLSAVTTTSAEAVHWLTEAMRAIFPDEWEHFAAAAADAPGERLIDRYYALITDPSLEVRAAAARAWCDWEDVHVSLEPNHKRYKIFDDEEFRLQFATLVIHYWKHSAFLRENQLLEDMARLGGVRGVLINGRMDISGPVVMAWELHRAWPGSELIIVEDEGHGGETMRRELKAAIKRLIG